MLCWLPGMCCMCQYRSSMPRCHLLWTCSLCATPMLPMQHREWSVQCSSQSVSAVSMPWPAQVHSHLAWSQDVLQASAIDRPILTSLQSIPEKTALQALSELAGETPSCHKLSIYLARAVC